MQEVQTFGDRGIPRIDAPARLLVAATAEQQLEPVLEMLAGAGFARNGTRVENRLPGLVELPGRQDLEAVAEWLRGNEDAHLLLLFNAPVPWIARKITNGIEPAEALGQWRSDAEHILAVVRRNRRRLSLLPLEGPLANPAAFMQTLSERFGLAIQVPQSIEQPPEPPGPIFRMMAENAVWQSAEARHLAAELEANALPMPPAHELMLPAVDEVYQEFTQTVDRTHARKEEYKTQLKKAREHLQAKEQEKAKALEPLKELEEENELLLQQLHQVQEELEGQFQESRELSEKLKEAEAAAVEKASDEEADRVREEQPKLEARVKDLEEENELLLQQLHHVQEELESYYLNGMDSRHELEEARATIEAMCNSKSWKITRPLRWFLEKFMGAEKAVR